MTLPLAKWTLEDYHRMIEAGILDDRAVELLDGEIVEMSPEGKPHAFSSDEAGEYLARLLGDLARVRHAKPITLSDGSEPESDIAIVQRLGREYLEHHPYPENIFWVIEYSDSTLDKDLEVKSKIYAASGIREYWLVNLKQNCLIVFRSPIAGEYTTRMTLTRGTISPIVFPDLSLEVDRIITL